MVSLMIVAIDEQLDLLFEITREDVEAARVHLRALLGTVTLKPRNGILWAHPAPNAKGLTEVRPLDGLRINSHLFGSGGVICSVPTVRQRIRLKLTENESKTLESTSIISASVPLKNQTE
jgi:hypothetical protein